METTTENKAFNFFKTLFINIFIVFGKILLGCAKIVLIAFANSSNEKIKSPTHKEIWCGEKLSSGKYRIK